MQTGSRSLTCSSLANQGTQRASLKGYETTPLCLPKNYWMVQTEALVQKVIGMALEGDITALRLCLERLCPPRKSRPINIKLPEIKTAEGIADAQNAIMSAVANGEITPEEGSVLSGILEARRKTVETEEHERRIAELEARHGKGSSSLV